MTFRIFALALIGALALAACSKPAAPPVPPPPAAVTVNIIYDRAVGQGRGVLYGGEFRPREISLAAGGTVTWNNTDNQPHTVISRDGLFDMTLQSGDSANFTFTQNGTFNYYDKLYDDLDGTIHVVNSNGTSK